MDAEGDEPEREYEERRCHWIELGLGAASVLVPEHWPIEKRDIDSVTVDVVEIPGATFSAELTCFEDPEAIASNDLERHITHPAVPRLTEEALDDVRDASGRPDFEELTIHYGCTEGGKAGDPGVTAEIDIWRRIYLLRPNYIRVIEFCFNTPTGPEVDNGYRREFASGLPALIRETTCADTATPFDRVAPTYGLKLSPLWDCIYMRVPETWERERENPDDTGMFLFDDKEKDRWTLWVDYDAYSMPEADRDSFDVVAEARSLAEGLEWDDCSVEELASTDDRAEAAILKHVYTSTEDGTPLRHVAWHKFVRTKVGLTIGHFTWVVPQAFVEDEDIRTLTDLVEREVGNALIVASYRRDRDGGEAAAASQMGSGRPIPAEGWKRFVLWGFVHLWLPEHWTALQEEDGDDVCYKYEDAESGSWALRIRRAMLPAPDSEAVPNVAVRRRIVTETTETIVSEMLQEFSAEESTTIAERLPPADKTAPAGVKRHWTSIDEEKGEQRLRTAWHRFAWADEALFDIFFEWSVAERVAEEPEMRRLSGLVEQAVMQAAIAVPE